MGVFFSFFLGFAGIRTWHVGSVTWGTAVHDVRRDEESVQPEPEAAHRCEIGKFRGDVLCVGLNQSTIDILLMSLNQID